MSDLIALNPATLIGIAVMAAVTFGLKLAGYYTQHFLTPGPRLTRFLNALPGTVILSLVAVMAVRGGISGITGLLCGVALVARIGNLTVATLIGFAIALLVRTLTGS